MPPCCKHPISMCCSTLSPMPRPCPLSCTTPALAPFSPHAPARAPTSAPTPTFHARTVSRCAPSDTMLPALCHVAQQAPCDAVLCCWHTVTLCGRLTATLCNRHTVTWCSKHTGTVWSRLIVTVWSRGSVVRGRGGGGLAQGLGIRLFIRLFAFGGACWPLATAHSDPLWARMCFGCVNRAPG